MYGRTFCGDADLAAQCTHWLDTVANVRVHATTKEWPRTRWHETEHAALGPLAARPYRSLVLVPEPPPVASHAPVTRVEVERRRLGTYAALAEAAS